MKVHTRDGVAQTRIARRALQSIGQQCTDNRVALKHLDGIARRSQEQRILAKSCRRVKGNRMFHAASTRSTDQQLALQGPLLKAGNHVRKIGNKLHGPVGEGQAFRRLDKLQPRRACFFL